ncbi:MAG: 3-deoxy-D-manno-octulosonic acid transferase [Alphaproteobacteria bacterium]|nr:3-deoxy-D-manno-octulosonic acid transferase [Alphaproteobacteria bacterium]
MSGWLYSTLMRALQPWLRRKLARRAQSEPGYAHAVGQRFGRYETQATACDLWIHAVSLGEARAAAILMAELRRHRPGLRVLLTHGTATGWAQGKELLQDGDQQAWLPWDTPEAVASFLDHFQPPMGLLMETEVWPNLTLTCQRRGIPLVLANARLSAQSLRQALRLGFWARPGYQALAEAWPQTKADAERLAQLGVRRMQVMGNLKFDAQMKPTQLALGHDLRARLGRPVLLLASSREGEEAAWAQALQSHEGAALPWVVPRHPQRFDAVADLLQAQGWHVLRRSQLDLSRCDAVTVAHPRTVVLGDTLGEMALYYALAHVALMGGSFERHGGQNLIEALACGCPVVLGPHTYNFEQASTEALAQGAAQPAQDLTEGVKMGLDLCANPARQAQMSAKGLALLDAHRGVAQRMAVNVLLCLDQAINSTKR